MKAGVVRGPRFCKFEVVATDIVDRGRGHLQSHKGSGWQYWPVQNFLTGDSINAMDGSINMPAHVQGFEEA